MVLYHVNIVTGCTEFLDTKRVARGIGHAGMVQPLNNFVLEGCCTMRTRGLVTGQRMLTGVKNIVSECCVTNVYFLRIDLNGLEISCSAVGYS